MAHFWLNSSVPLLLFLAPSCLSPFRGEGCADAGFWLCSKYQRTSHNFLHFLVGWCHGSSPDGNPRWKPLHHHGEIPSLKKRRHCKKKWTFGEPREVSGGLCELAQTRALSHREDRTEFLKEFRQVYWLLFLKQPHSCSDSGRGGIFRAKICFWVTSTTRSICQGPFPAKCSIRNLFLSRTSLFSPSPLDLNNNKKLGFFPPR